MMLTKLISSLFCVCIWERYWIWCLLDFPVKQTRWTQGSLCSCLSHWPVGLDLFRWSHQSYKAFHREGDWPLSVCSLMPGRYFISCLLNLEFKWVFIFVHFLLLHCNIMRLHFPLEVTQNCFHYCISLYIYLQVPMANRVLFCCSTTFCNVLIKWDFVVCIDLMRLSVIYWLDNM